MTGEEPGAPFRGGFRFVPETGPEDGACLVEAWGRDVAELLPRVVEAASGAAGGVDAEHEARPRTLGVRAGSLVTVVEALVGVGLGTPVLAAACERAPPEGPWDGEESVELRLRTTAAGAARLDLAYTPGSARVWREDRLLRARFHVRSQ